MKVARPHRGFRGISSGVSAFAAGLKVVLPGGGLFRFALLPAGVSLVILGAVVAASFVAARYFLGEWLESTWLAWLGSLLAVLSGLVLAYFVFVPVMNLFAPWFIDPICEEVFRRCTGREIDAQGPKRNVAVRVLIGIAQFFAGLLIVVFIQLPLAVAALFTGVTGVIAIAINGFMMGSELMDHPIACAGGTLGDRVAWLKSNFWPAVGLGAAASICVVIPVLNLLVLPAGAAAATMLYAATLPDSGEQAKALPVILDNR
jgi:CysZ protein